MLYQLIVVCVCVVACSAEFYQLPKDDYSPERLEGDGDEIKRRLDCFRDLGPCTRVTAAYRNDAEDMILTACIKCSPELKSLAQAFLNGAKEKYPAEYKELILKYDPTTLNFNAFESAVGVIKTVISALPSLPSGASVPSIPSVPTIISSVPGIPSIPSIPSLASKPSLPLFPSWQKS